MVVWREPDALDDDDQRWDSLRSYNILDTEPEPAYDRITQLCQSLFEVPIAMIAFVDRDRLWFKSVVGLPGLKETERRASVCAWTLLSRFPEALVIPDLLEDMRFKDHPGVCGWPHARFYAASPLVASSGQRIGALCIMDAKPRQFSSESAMMLAQLGMMVVREVERKRALNDVLCTSTLRIGRGSIATDPQGVMLVDVSVPKWPILLVNDAWVHATGVSHEMATGSRFWDLFELPARVQEQACALAVQQTRNFELRVFGSRRRATRCGSGSGSSGGSGGARPRRSLDACATPAAALGSSSVRRALSHDAYSSPTLVACCGSACCGGGGGACACSSNSGAAAAAAAAANSCDEPSGSRCGGGGRDRRWTRMRFLSSTSAAALRLAISIPPMLQEVHSEGGGGTQPPCYYWATTDAPRRLSQSSMPQAGSDCFADGAATADDGDEHHTQQAQPPAGGSVCGGSSTPAPPTTASAYCGDSGAAAAAHHAAFSLLPDESPFADITLGSLVGWGSYGRVHRGYWKGGLVAVKVLEQVAGDVNARTCLEPLLHNRLSHPSVVRLLEASSRDVELCEDGQTLQEVWMVLEYCNRGTLWESVARGALLQVQDGALVPGAVDVAKVVSTAREVAGAMMYLHSQNVLHGDLNCSNVLLVSSQPGRPYQGATVEPAAGLTDSRDFSAKVGDFGLSRILSPDNDTIVTRTHGTITHMAPEVILESRHSKPADVYSFGVILWELLAAQKAYHGLHYAKIIQSITCGQGLQLPPPGVALPARLEELVGSCLSRTAQQRPTFGELYKQLTELEVECLASGCAAALPSACSAAATALLAAAAGMGDSSDSLALDTSSDDGPSAALLSELAAGTAAVAAAAT